MREYILPLVHVPTREMIILRHAFDRMEGTMAYINMHDRSAYRDDAKRTCDRFFARIEALIPQEDA